MTIRRIYIFRFIAVTVSVLLTLLVLDVFYNANTEVVNKNNFKEYNDSIIEANQAVASLNPHGFTDSVRSKTKPDSIFRVAVIGDSFIWGDGLPYTDVWSHKLERLMRDQFRNVEVMSWGIKGWSTLDEYNFYINIGHTYDIDLLLFGFVHNDPDMGDYKHMSPLWYKRLGFMYKIFPRLTGSVLDYLYNGSYARWMEKLYSDKNLLKFETLLAQIKNLETDNNIKVAFVMTPSAINSNYDVFFPKISTILQRLNLPHANLYPNLKARFEHVNPDSLKANPANPHPGEKLNTFYADEALSLILKNNLIDTSLYRKTF